MNRYVEGGGRAVYRARDHSWSSKFGGEDDEFGVNK